MGKKGKIPPAIAASAWILLPLILYIQLTGSLATTGVFAAQERQLSYGTTVEGILTPTDPWHAWQFIGSAGDVVSIEMNAVFDPDFTGLDTLLVLEFEDGTLLAEDDDGGEETNSRIENFELPADGIYTVVATSLSGEEIGRYELRLDRVRRLARRMEYVGAVGYHERIRAELSPEVVGHLWEFEGRAGDEVSIALDALDEDLNPFLLLLQMSEAQLETFFTLDDEQLSDLVSAAEELGALLELNDDREGEINALLPSFVLPRDGRYFILATSCCTGESSGPYELALDLAPAQFVEPPLLVPDDIEPDVDEPDGDEPDQQAFDEPPAGVEGPRISLLPVVVGGGLLLGLLFLVGIVATLVWRRFRTLRVVHGPGETLPLQPSTPPAAAPVVRFKHKWDPGRVSIGPSRRPLKFDVDIRFRLSPGSSAQHINQGGRQPRAVSE